MIRTPPKVEKGFRYVRHAGLVERRTKFPKVLLKKKNAGRNSLQGFPGAKNSFPIEVESDEHSVLSQLIGNTFGMAAASQGRVNDYVVLCERKALNSFM